VPWAELELYIFNVPSKPESKISRCVDMVYDHLRSTGLFHEDAVLLVYTCSSEAPPFRTPDQNLHPKPLIFGYRILESCFWISRQQGQVAQAYGPASL